MSELEIPNYRQEREADGRELLEENLLEHIYELEAPERDFTEKEKRALVFLLETDGFRLFMKRLGVEVTQGEVMEALSGIMADESEFLFYLGDELFVTLTEAAELFGIKRPRLMTAVTYKHVPTYERWGAMYNYTTRGAKKLIHAKLTDVGKWLRGRADLLKSRGRKPKSEVKKKKEEVILKEEEVSKEVISEKVRVSKRGRVSKKGGVSGE